MTRARAYWTHLFVDGSLDVGVVFRSSPSGHHCEETERDVPSRDAERLDAAIDAGAVFYISPRGVFQASPASLGWHRSSCRGV